MLPELLRNFALRIGAEGSSHIYLDTMYFTHKYRLQITSAFQEVYFENEGNHFRVDEKMDIPDLIRAWLDNLEPRHALAPCEVFHQAQWDPLAFCKEQGYPGRPEKAIENALTLTRGDNNVELLTCSGYVCRTFHWLKSIIRVRSLLNDETPIKNVDRVRIKLYDGTKLEGSIMGAKLAVEVSGVSGTVAEVGELLGWITTALRSHSFSGITKCTPSIKCIRRINKPDHFVSEKSATVSFEFDYTLEKDLEKTSSINGLCWRQKDFRDWSLLSGSWQRKSKKEVFYYHLSDRVDELYCKIDLIQAHLADKEDKDGIRANIRLSMRRNLEGFDFFDIAHEEGLIRAKAGSTWSGLSTP
ncbi:hypothetical protein V8E54_001059 [Elaphomyces granulatus]